jgi:hypothetical protein
MQISTAINIPKPNMIAGQVGPAAYGPGFITDFTSGNQSLDKRITFSRASNATVTDSSGNIVYAPHNLLTFSEQFDNAAWTKNAATITANATTAPNGTITADKLVETTASSIGHFVTPTAGVVVSVGVTYTYSAYVKAAERTFFQIIVTGVGPTGANLIAGFDLSNGTAGTPNAGTSAIVSVGDGWYRCSFTVPVVTAATPSAQLRLALNSTAVAASYTGDGTSGVFIWGAQWEIGSTATTYNPTTVKNLLGFSESFDNAAWTKSNSFIQTNLLTFSEQFDNAAWTKNDFTVTANATTAPNGSLTADRAVRATTANTFNSFSQNITVTTSVPYTVTCYVKADQYKKFGIREGSTSGAYASFDLTTGVLIESNAGGGFGLATSITDVGGGWYRCSFTIAIIGTTFGVRVNPLPDSYTSGSTSYSWAGNTTDGIFIWGAQLVQGSVAGDYQQTTSSALAVMYQDPNGTMTADKLVEDTATTTHNTRQQVNNTINTTPYTLTVYAKAGERTFVGLAIQETGAFSRQSNVRFNLITGTAGSVSNLNGSLGTASITNVGNGWYRCSLTVTLGGVATGMLNWIYSSIDSGFTYAGDGTSGIYIWGAQLSDSASLDQYVNNPVAAPSSTAFYGARFDYDPVTLQPRGLLIEEQRSNLILQSETFDNASWGKQDSTITANAAVSPDGTQDADKIVENTATGGHYVSQFVAVASAVTYTFSVFLKAAERGFAIVRSAGTTGVNGITVDLTTGAVASGTGTVTNINSSQYLNGWWRVSFTYTSAGAGGNFEILTSTDGVYANRNYAGDGTSGIFVWGAQLEAGAFPTSYIPTTTAQVTRSADVALVQGSNFSSWFNVNEGTVYSQYSKFTTVSGRVLTISNGTTNNQIRFSVPSRIDWQIINGGSVEANILGVDIAVNAVAKVAGVYKINDIQAAVNGTLRTEDTTATIPTVSVMHIGMNESTTGSLNGHIRQIAYYPRRLQNSELASLTS